MRHKSSKKISFTVRKAKIFDYLRFAEPFNKFYVCPDQIKYTNSSIKPKKIFLILIF
jgi:hypothetical protein